MFEALRSDSRNLARWPLEFKSDVDMKKNRRQACVHELSSTYRQDAEVVRRPFLRDSNPLFTSFPLHSVLQNQEQDFEPKWYKSIRFWRLSVISTNQQPLSFSQQLLRLPNMFRIVSFALLATSLASSASGYTIAWWTLIGFRLFFLLLTSQPFVYRTNRCAYDVWPGVGRAPWVDELNEMVFSLKLMS